MWKKILAVFILWWIWQAYRFCDYYDMWWYILPGWV